MHVRTIEFLGVVKEGPERVIGAVKSPTEMVTLKESLGAIRIAFDTAFAPLGAKAPNIAGINDSNFRSHNVQLPLSKEMAKKFGVGYVAGKLVVEDPKTFRIDIARGTDLVKQDGSWPADIAIDCAVFLRGTEDAANKFPELADDAGRGLDGEPKPPSGGVMSGNGIAGGDFTAPFTVLIKP